MERTSRRDFILRGGALAGGLLLAGPSGALAAPRGDTAAAVALQADRRATFAALADAVLTDSPYRLPDGAGDRAATDFTALYVTWDRDRRARADATLDAIERAEGTSFQRAARRRRQAVLREHATPARSLPTAQERKRLDLAQAALELVGAAATADTDLDHSPTTL